MPKFFKKSVNNKMQASDSDSDQDRGSPKTYFDFDEEDFRAISDDDLIRSLFGPLSAELGNDLYNLFTAQNERSDSRTRHTVDRIQRYLTQPWAKAHASDALFANAIGMHDVVRFYLKQTDSDKAIRTTTGCTLLMQVYQHTFNQIEVEDSWLATISHAYRDMDTKRYGTLSFDFIYNQKKREAWAAELIDLGASVDGTGEIDDYCNCTPLHGAIAYSDQIVLPKILALPECDVNAEAHDNQDHHPVANMQLFEYVSPLFIAMRTGNEAALSSLLAHPKIQLSSRIGHAPYKDLVRSSVDIPAKRIFHRSFPSIGAFEGAIADLDEVDKYNISSDPRQKGRGDFQVHSNRYFTPAELMASWNQPRYLAKLYAHGLMPLVDTSQYSADIIALGEYADSIRSLKGIAPLTKFVYAMPNTPAMRAKLIDRLNLVDRQFVSALKQNPSTHKLIAEFTKGRFAPGTSTISLDGASTRQVQLADIHSLERRAINTHAGAKAVHDKLESKKRSRDDKQKLVLGSTVVTHTNSAVRGHLGGLFIKSFPSSTPRTSSGTYNEICRDLTRLCGGNKNSKTQAIAEYLLSVTKNHEDISILKKAGIAVTKFNLDLLKHVYVLSFIKEITRRYATGIKYDGTLPARLPFAICQIFSLQLLAKGVLGLRDVFSNDARYGLPTAKGVTSTQLANSRLKVINTCQAFIKHILLPHYAKDPRVLLFQHNVSGALLTLSSEYLHQHILLAHYGGASESDGDPYAAPGSPKAAAVKQADLFARTARPLKLPRTASDEEVDETVLA